MAAIAQALVSIVLNGLTPTGAAGIPGTAIGTPVGTTAMKMRLNSTLSTAAAAGTDSGTPTSRYHAGGVRRHRRSDERLHGGRVDVAGRVHGVIGGQRGGGAADHPVVRLLGVPDG